MNASRIFILMILSCAFASSAFAVPPDCVGPPGWAGKGGDPNGPPDGIPKPRATILHCGCTDDGESMQYVEINVSSRSKGHQMHVRGTFDSCAGADGNFVDFERTESDCQIDGPEMGGTVELCSDDQLDMYLAEPAIPCGAPAPAD